MVFSPLLVAALLPLAAQAANDWSKPCFGECNWDIHTGTGSGTVRVSGSQTGVSDLTTAAGWTIMDCNSTATNQEIRLVCHDETKGCDHINQNGANGTLVRLPTSCGSMPFAIVTNSWVHQNQTLPAAVQSQISRRSGSKPVVKGMTLSTNFTAVDPSTHGNVAMYLQGSSVPGAAQYFSVSPPTEVTSKRGLSDWVGSSLFSIGKFNKNLTGSSPINFSKDVPLFDQSFDCPQSGAVPEFTGEVKVDLNADVSGAVNYGVAIAGSLIPPKVSEFGLFAGLDATLKGTLGINATVTGSISTGPIPLFTVGLPGLDFPEILQIGPTFSVNAEADASLDANLDMGVDIAYTISNAELFFPPSSSSSGSFVPGDSNINLGVSPNVTSNGQVSAHLIPTIAFGVTVLGSGATINLNVDGNAALDLSLTAAAEASTGTNGSTTGAEFGGCVDITTGLSVNAAADASLLSFFNQGASVSLFSKTFDLFKKCFGSTAARRAYPVPVRAARRALVSKRDGLSCPTSLFGSVASIVEDTVSSSDIEAAAL